MKIHHPPHIYLDNTYYFLTARTYKGNSIFDNDEKKEIFLSNLKAEVLRHGYKIIAWVILDNHYHILFKSELSSNLSKIINKVHGLVSYKINKLDELRGRKIFQNYWDKCIRNEKDFWCHFNYIHHNPVKHRYVKKMKDYKFSSYNYWLEKKGKEWLSSCFTTYPIIDFSR